MRVGFIVNPNAANGSCRKIWPAIEDKARQLFDDVLVFETECQGDGTPLVHRAQQEQVDLFVSVGGDGTHNEVVSGIVQHAPGAELGILSIGTGGDFRKTFGIQKDPMLALEQLAGGYAKDMDAGKIEYISLQDKPETRYFANIASIGIGGLVDKLVNESSKALGGKASFFVGSLRATMQYKNFDCRIELDGNTAYEGPLFLVSVCNGQFYGGGMNVAPMADPHDGLFDVVIMEDFGWGDKLRMAKNIYKGKHIGSPRIQHHRARHMQLTTEATAAWIDLDGEFPGRMPGSCTILPAAYRLRVPAGYASRP